MNYNSYSIFYHRSLPLNTPVYFAGLPSSLVPATASPFSLYTGCLSNVIVDRTLIDFSSIPMEGTITNGCLEANEGMCQDGCIDDNCVNDLWNGTSCNEQLNDAVSLNGTGYITLVNPVNIEKFHIQFRTLQRNFVLAQLGGNDTTINVS